MRAAYGTPIPTQVPPVVNVEDFGAVGDGITDDSDAINRAIRSLSSGGTVVLAPGRTYMKRKLITLNRENVQLWGYGATLYSYVTPAQVAGPKGSMRNAIVMSAPGTGVYGVTLVTNLRVRREGHPFHAGVWIAGTNQVVMDSRFEYTDNATIARDGKGYFVARNVAYRTQADGFHQTTNSENGVIVCNHVRENGDDGISIVEYKIGDPTLNRYLIAENVVQDQYWGRGITVSGATDVTVRGNTVIGNALNAGIFLVSERTYRTADVRNTLVENNTIRDIQVRRAPYNPRGDTQRTGQAGIEISGDLEGQLVSNVVVRNNTLDNLFKAGLRVRNNVCNIGLALNRVSNAQVNITLEQNARAGCNVACNGNIYDGVGSDPAACSANPLPVVTGR